MIPFYIKPSLVTIPVSEHVSFSDEGLLLETFEFFEISQGSYQPLNFLLKYWVGCLLKFLRHTRLLYFFVYVSGLNLHIKMKPTVL